MAWDAGVAMLGIACGIALVRTGKRLRGIGHRLGAAALFLVGAGGVFLAPNSSPLRTVAPFLVAAAVAWLCTALAPTGR